jgi:hypothetical protein
MSDMAVESLPLRRDGGTGLMRIALAQTGNEQGPAGFDVWWLEGDRGLSSMAMGSTSVMISRIRAARSSSGVTPN